MPGVDLKVIQCVRPARAGMSPITAWATYEGERPPRASGDEPFARYQCQDCGKSAPRERG